MYDVSALSELTKLQALDIAKTRVRLVAPLSNLQHLEVIFIVDDKIDDLESLALLAGLKVLKEDVPFTPWHEGTVSIDWLGLPW